MTKPSITYGHGYLYDCHTSTGWSSTNSGLTNPYAGIEHNDWLKLEGTCTSTGNEYIYFKRTTDDLNSNTTVYPKYLVRFLTEASSNGLKAWIRLTLFDPVTEETTYQDINLGYSNTWKVSTGNLTTGKIIKNISFYADDDPDTVTSGTYYVLYDFFLAVKGIFTFPNTMFGKEYVPAPRNIALEIPSRITDINQNLGSKSAVWQASCNLDIGNWKRLGDTVNGQVFDEISHNSYKEPFQWFNTGMGRQFKVVLDGEPRFSEEGKQHRLDLLFREYSRSSKSNESYIARFGLNLI